MNVAILQQRMDLLMFLYAVLNTVQLPYLKCMLVTIVWSSVVHNIKAMKLNLLNNPVLITKLA